MNYKICAFCGLRIPGPYEIFDNNTKTTTVCFCMTYDVPKEIINFLEEKGRLNKKEPEPKHNESKPVWELVIEDMKQRDNFGRNKYGTPLQANNGRDALVDVYQELLDAAVYIRQLIEERKSAK